MLPAVLVTACRLGRTRQGSTPGSSVSAGGFCTPAPTSVPRVQRTRLFTPRASHAEAQPERTKLGMRDDRVVRLSSYHSGAWAVCSILPSGDPKIAFSSLAPEAGRGRRGQHHGGPCASDGPTPPSVTGVRALAYRSNQRRQPATPRPRHCRRPGRTGDQQYI